MAFGFDYHLVFIHFRKTTHAPFWFIGFYYVYDWILFAFYLGIDKLFINTTGRLITERPQFYLALTAMLIGTQLFLAGF